MENKILEELQVEKFHEDGFIGPFRVLSEERATEIREEVDELLRNGPPEESKMPANFYRHTDSEVVWNLCSHEEIVGRMNDIYGPDLMLWNSKFWQKPPGAKEVPWHQHYHHVPLEPPVTLTAWVALTDVTEENGACQILPGTHTEVIPEVPSLEEHWDGFPNRADPDEFEVEDSVTMDIDAGEAFIFNERTIHRSFPNTSDSDRRLSLSVRVSLPHVNFDTSYVSDGESDFTTAMMLSGEDVVQQNKMRVPPVSD